MFKSGPLVNRSGIDLYLPLTHKPPSSVFNYVPLTSSRDIFVSYHLWAHRVWSEVGLTNQLLNDVLPKHRVALAFERLFQCESSLTTLGQAQHLSAE